ncbi:GAF and ANTAR domain-containing protein [Streptomyces daliensis]|uniref:GAF and ANTAR domain-containing protein n=1 Tax=Streptomyces daliensis TaxID=299421 RepID=A0A8T4IS36_9ACTN|nr:GAF and ANTAR domain-containing protein [Streptomyces daliensis]
MNPQGRETDADLAMAAQRRAALARERAERAEATARKHERLARESGQRFHEQLALTHRRTAACHRASARLQESFALRAAAWTKGQGDRPRFMAVVAEACDTDSAAMTLLDAERNQLAVAVSDERSRAAQDLEYVLGEGPGQEAAAELRQVRASGREVVERWPEYGTSLASLGIATVTAVPLRTAESCIGALTVFDPRPVPGGSPDLSEIAEALTRIVLLEPDADPGLYGGTDIRATVQQAAGMLSARLGCSIADALTLIKARAFTEDVSVETVARRIVDGDLTFR